MVYIFTAVLIAQPAGAQSRTGIEQLDGVAGAAVRALRMQRAGEYPAARTILLAALSETPESASLLGTLASVEQDMGEYLEAERSYLHALGVATRSQVDIERITILNNLGTLYLDTRQYSKAERVRDDLERMGPGAFESYPALSALLQNLIASLEHARNRDDEAARHYEQALRLFRSAQGPVSIDAAIVESNLGTLYWEAGQYGPAGDLFRQSIRDIKTASGPQNPALVRSLINLAGCENMSGHPNEAEALARSAVELSGKILGLDHPVTARAELQLASVLRKLRRKTEARELEKRAQALLRNASETSPARYTVGLQELAPHVKR